MPYAFVVSFPLRFHLLNLFEKRCTVWRIVLTPDLNILWITFMWGAEQLLNPEKKRDQNCKICFVRRPQTHNHITNRCMFHFITRCMNRRIALWGVSKGLKPLVGSLLISPVHQMSLHRLESESSKLKLLLFAWYLIATIFL